MNVRTIRRFVGMHESAIGILLGVATCALACLLIWGEGKKEGRREIRLEQIDSLKKVNAAKLKVDHAKSASAKQISAAAVVKSDSARSRAAAARAESDTARAIARAAQAKVVLAGDTAIVGLERQILLPEIATMIRTTSSAAVKDSVTIRRQADAIATGSSTISLQQGTIVAMEAEIADHVAGEQLLEEQLELTRSPRCGRKCGAAIGAGITVILVRIAALLL